MDLEAQPQQKHFAIYTLICVWKQYFQLLNWHKIVTYIIILTFFFLKAILIINWFLWRHLSSYWKTTCTIWPNGQGTKISIFKHFSELGKIWKYNLSFPKSQFPISFFYELGKTWKYTQPQTIISKSKCWIYIWLGKTYVII